LHSHISIRRLIIVLLISTTSLLSGCASNLTRFTDYTPYSPPHESCAPLCNVEMQFTLFDMTQMDVTVALYGGLLQVRQPLSMLLNQEDQMKIREGAPQAVLYGFVNELTSRGFKVTIRSPEETADADPPPGWARVSCDLEALRLDIFDPGMSGFGSAGDYSEATVNLRSFSVRFQGVDYPISLTKENFKAKTKGSLLAYTWSFGDFVFHMAKAAAKIVTIGESSIIAKGVNRSLEIELPEMRIQEGKMSPVELAARLAAIDFIEALHAQLPPPK
jgi:hypothetical protein